MNISVIREIRVMNRSLAVTILFHKIIYRFAFSVIQNPFVYLVYFVV